MLMPQPTYSSRPVGPAKRLQEWITCGKPEARAQMRVQVWPPQDACSVTATIIGGTNLFGGRGSILGTVIGALIMGVLQNGLNLIGVSSYYQQIAIGAVLVFAVWLNRLNRSEGRRP